MPWRGDHPPPKQKEPINHVIYKDAMAILMIGGTGQIGSLVTAELAKRGAQVRALGTKQPSSGLPPGVELVTGDVLDVDLMRKLLGSASTVFVLNPAVPDELARVLLILSLIEEAGVKGVVYVSMMGADRFGNASRAAAKFAAEQTIRQRNIPATILRPNALFQNDQLQKSAIVERRTYPTPVGSVGVTMVDIRDVAEVAALELLRREQASDPLPTEMIELVGPEVLTGEKISGLWSDVLGQRVTYTGDDLKEVERAFRQAMPAAGAYDIGLVFRGILEEGVLGEPGAAERLVELLGRPLQTYRAFAEELVAADPA